MPGSNSSPDLTKLAAPRVVHLVAAADEDIRQLHFTKKVPFDFITRKQMDTRVVHTSLEDYPRAQADTDSEILAMLGAVPTGTDLRSVTKQALGGQVAGYYDDHSRKLVVGTAGAAHLSSSEVTTLAHELDHALTDQGLGFPALHDAQPALGDESLARHALLEGDAVLDQTFFQFAYLSVAQQLQTSRDPAARRADKQLATVPHYLTAGFLFPYTEGLNFVCSLYLDGGWIAVDEAYLRPPATSAQIMWPQRYRDHERAIVPRPPNAPSSWQRVTRVSVGAANLKALFEAPGNDVGRSLSNPRGKARAWAGGSVSLFHSGSDGALALDLVERRQSNNLCASIRTWYRRAFPDASVVDRGPGHAVIQSPESAAFIGCRGHYVRVGIAPTTTTAHILAR